MKLSTEQIIKLKKLLPFYERIISLFAGKTIYIKISNMSAYDGTYIYIPAETLAKGLEDNIMLERAFIHEGGHAIFTQMGAPTDYINKNKIKNRWFKLFGGFTEDIRMEYNVIQLFLGTKKILRESAKQIEKLLNKAIEIAKEKKHLNNQQLKDNMNLLHGILTYTSSGFINKKFSKKVINVINKHKQEIINLKFDKTTTEGLPNSYKLFQKFVNEGFFQDEQIDDEIVKILHSTLPKFIPTRALIDVANQSKYDEIDSIEVKFGHGTSDDLQYKVKNLTITKNYKDYIFAINGNYNRLLNLLKQLILKSKRSHFESGYRQGHKINNKIISKWLTKTFNHDRIFMKKFKTKKYNYAFMFLLDLSGSIKAEDIELLKHCMVLFSNMLGDIGVKFSILGYTTERDYSNKQWWLIYNIKRFSDLYDTRTKDKIVSIHSGSNTPTYPAFAYASNILENQPEQEKYLILLTDGVNDSGTTGRKKIKKYIKLHSHINYFAIGVTHSTYQYLQESFNKNVYKIEEYSGLYNELMRIIRKIFLGR